MDYIMYLLLNSKDLKNNYYNKALTIKNEYMNRKEYYQFPWQNKQYWLYERLFFMIPSLIEPDILGL